MEKHLGIVLTTPPSSENAEKAINLASRALCRNWIVDIFLISDAVLLAKKNICEDLKKVISKGANVIVSVEYVKAASIENKLIDDVDLADKSINKLVHMIMEKWDRIIVY